MASEGPGPEAGAILLSGASALLDGRSVAADILVTDGNIASILRPGTPALGGACRHGSAPAVRGAAGRTGVPSHPALDPTVPRIDLRGCTILPGFIDIHTHGGDGVDFNRAEPGDVRRVASFFASRGVTSFLPSVLTDSPGTMERCMAVLGDPSLRADCPQILGIHLEGPFLSPRHRGAQPERFLQSCDPGLFARLQDAARGTIRVVTLAPELEGAPELVRDLTAAGVRVSLGHSDASYEEAAAAIRAGAVCATHVMNAMKGLHMHDPGILAAVLESDIFAEMICDGFHLHPPIVRLLLKTKGRERMIAVTDSIMAAGLPDGTYALGVNDVVVENGDARLAAGGMRAGSTLTMIGALRNIVAFTGMDPAQASPLLSENPARMLGIFDRTGSIGEGKAADLVALDGALEPRMTMARGRVVFANLPGPVPAVPPVAPAMWKR